MKDVVSDISQPLSVEYTNYLIARYVALYVSDKQHRNDIIVGIKNIIKYKEDEMDTVNKLFTIIYYSEALALYYAQHLYLETDWTTDKDENGHPKMFSDFQMSEKLFLALNENYENNNGHYPMNNSYPYFLDGRYEQFIKEYNGVSFYKLTDLIAVNNYGYYFNKEFKTLLFAFYRRHNGDRNIDEDGHFYLAIDKEGPLALICCLDNKVVNICTHNGFISKEIIENSVIHFIEDRRMIGYSHFTIPYYMTYNNSLYHEDDINFNIKIDGDVLMPMYNREDFKTLPKNMVINGDLYIDDHQKLTNLNNISVNGDVYITNCTKLVNLDLSSKGYVFFYSDYTFKYNSLRKLNHYNDYIIMIKNRTTLHVNGKYERWFKKHQVPFFIRKMFNFFMDFLAYFRRMGKNPKIMANIISRSTSHKSRSDKYVSQGYFIKK